MKDRRISLACAAAAALCLAGSAFAQDLSEAVYGLDQDSAEAAAAAPAPRAGGPSSLGPGTKTVDVDCAAGDSITDALKRKADELIINISGLCVEDVTVRRDRVTFRGTDPLTDGIQAATTDDPFGAALLIRESRFIRVENLKLTGAPRTGLRIENARRHVYVDNCRLEGNDNFGLVVLGGLTDVTDTVITGNGDAGIAASENGFVLCDNCTVVDNPAADEGFGVISSLASSVSLRNSTVTANFALEADAGAFITVRDSTITGNPDPVFGFGLGLIASDNGEITVFDSTLNGSIQVSNQGQIFLTAVDQTSNPVGNLVLDNGNLRVRGRGGPTPVPSNLIGTTSFVRFGRGIFQSGTNLDILTCNQGADAVCTAGVTKTSSTCALCP